MEGARTLVYDLAGETSERDPSIRIWADEPLGAAIRRICVGQIDRALAELTDSGNDRDVAVHRARKALKRTRAMIRLVRDRVGYRAYREENVVLRDAGRALAPMRDGAVMVQVLDRLLEGYGLGGRPFEAARRRLAFRHHEARSRILGDPMMMGHVVTTLAACRSRFAAWPVDRPGHAAAVPDDFAAIVPGIRRTYRRGLEAARRSTTAPTTPAVHEWRKRVKYLRHQMEAVEPVEPEVLGEATAAFDLLGETLGDEHDLALFEDVVEDVDGLPDGQRRLLVVLAHAERTRLQAVARPLGARLYAETPDGFVDRIGSYWRAWRRGAAESAGDLRRRPVT